MLKLVSNNRSKTLRDSSSPQSLPLHQQATNDTNSNILNFNLQRIKQEQPEKSYDTNDSNFEISQYNQDASLSGVEESRLNLLVKAAERIGEENHKNDEPFFKSTKNPKTQFSNEQKTSLNEFVNSKQIYITNEQHSLPVFIGKNGKPTRPFKAYTRDPLTISIEGLNNTAQDVSFVNLTSPPLSSSSPIPPTNEQPASSNSNQAQQQNHLLQLLSQQIIQQQQSHQKNAENINNNTNNTMKTSPQVVINLEDILNVILNAASIVSSQSIPSNSNILVKTAQHQIQETIPEQPTKSPMSNEENATVATSISSQFSSDEVYDTSSNNNMDFNSYDDMTKMSLMNSNDFCTQYKKRIQQAKERLIQKKLQEEQELAKRLESKQDKKINRKRSQQMSEIEPTEVEFPKKRANNEQDPESSPLSVPENNNNNNNLNSLIKELTENKLNNELIRRLLINDLGDCNNLNEQQQSKFQLILSALAINDKLQKQPIIITTDTANIDSSANDSEEIQGMISIDESSLLNSYPPKKRHRMHQQQQDQQHQQKQKDKTLQSNNSNNNESASDQQILYQNESKSNNFRQANPETQKHHTQQQNNGSCSLSSSSSSISMSPSPQSSPSISMDSASGSSGSSIVIGKNDFNQYQVNK